MAVHQDIEVAADPEAEAMVEVADLEVVVVAEEVKNTYLLIEANTLQT